MRLFGYWRSSASWRVRVALHLKGIPHEVVPVNLLKAEHRLPEHLARSPLGQLPVLELDDGTCLTQSLATIGYLDALVPTPRLIPLDPVDRAQVWALAEVINSGTQPLQNMTLLQRISDLGGDRMAWGKRAIFEGLSGLQALSAPLRGHFLFGDAPSLADLCLVPQLYNARRFDVDLSTLQPLVDIEARCEAIEAFQLAHPDRQIDAA